MKNGDIAVIQNVDRVAKVFCVGLQWGGGLDAGDKTLPRSYSPGPSIMKGGSPLTALTLLWLRSFELTVTMSALSFSGL